VGAQRAQAGDELTNEGIDRDPAFRFELAEWYEDGPLVRAEGAETIEGQIGTFADAHAGVALQQQDSTGQIVAAQQFSLDELVLFGSEGARQEMVHARDVVGD
jgi:hypothetical protein